MVGIPFLGDQPKNVERLVQWGMALKIDVADLNADNLARSIITVATDPR